MKKSIKHKSKRVSEDLRQRIERLEKELTYLEKKEEFGRNVTEYFLWLIHDLENLDWGDWGEDGSTNLNYLIDKYKNKYDDLEYPIQEENQEEEY